MLRIDVPPKFEFRTDCDKCRNLQQALNSANACLEHAIHTRDVDDAKAAKVAYDVSFEIIGSHMRQAHVEAAP
jgi:hypothetical protein